MRIALPLYVSESLAYRLWGPYNGKYFLIVVEVGNLQMELARPTVFLFSYIPYAHAS